MILRKLFQKTINSMRITSINVVKQSLHI